MPAEAKALFAQYLAANPAEAHELTSFEQFLRTSSQLFDRKTLPGHITGSGLIWNPENQQWLVIFHPTFERWQQTGGHVEPEDHHIWEAALREAKEETTATQLELHPWHIANQYIPLAIDTHDIPAHRGKQELAHQHYDWEYLLVTHDTVPNTNQQKWVSFEEGLSLVTEPLHFAKVKEILFPL